jgi:branched-subunit amino acid ABC-type transport system permease component
MLEILPQLLLNSAISGSIYALVAVGMALTYRSLKVLNFAHGHLMMLGAYLFYYGHIEQEWNLMATIIFLITAIFALSFLILKVCIYPFRELNPLLVFVTTLALSTIIESVVAMVFGVNVKSLGFFWSADSIEIGSMYITPIQIVIIIVALIGLSLTALVMHHTSLGRAIRALSENSAAGKSLGLNEGEITFLLFFISLLFAAIAGVLIGFETNLQPTMGTPYTIKAFAALLLGGLGNFWGTIIGSYVLGLIENLSIGLEFGEYSLPAGYKDAFAFMIILIVLIFKPEGLFSKRKRSA